MNIDKGELVEDAGRYHPTVSDDHAEFCPRCSGIRRSL
jgi:hypothetical protein